LTNSHLSNSFICAKKLKNFLFDGYDELSFESLDELDGLLCEDLDEKNSTMALKLGN
jgi:hypothetical protein